MCRLLAPKVRREMFFTKTVQGAHASPPTPLHEKDIAISYAIQTVMLFMSFLDEIVLDEIVLAVLQCAPIALEFVVEGCVCFSVSHC